MLFGSFEFLLAFLPVCLLVYHACRVRGWQLPAKVFLVGASLFFYGWWDWKYVFLVLGSILGNYAVGAVMHRLPLNRRGPVLLLGLLFNLGLLGYYKYAAFFAGNLEAVFGWELGFRHIVLPLAISFFTFQQIAYIVEIRKGDHPAGSLLDYMLFILFFPHLIAGPITHHKEMLPQFAAAGRGPLPHSWVLAGLAVLILGLTKKVVVADTLATYADPVFVAALGGHAPTVADAWLGALAYTFQLYFDFSGYSDMAVGLGLLFGIRFPVNFFSPYKAGSIIEFWRRWHITLSAFLRNYVYVPLGGNRRGATRRYLNLLATMAVGGLWHGAAWTFVIWGVLHGLFLIVNHLWRAAVGELRSPAFAAFAWALTFLAVVVGWVFFRAPSVGSALGMLAAMAGAVPGTPVPDVPGPVIGWIVVAGAAAIAFLMPNVLQLARYPEAYVGAEGASHPGEATDSRPVGPRTTAHHPILARPGIARHAALAAAALGVLAGACFARLPDPGIFLYFNF